MSANVLKVMAIGVDGSTLLQFCNSGSLIAGEA